MAIFLYVHGIGNRTAAVNHTLSKLEKTLASSGFPDEHELDFCAWGTHLGTVHRPEGFKSIPGYADRGGGRPDPSGDAEEEVNLWELLYRDAFFELKLLGVLPKLPAKPGGPFASAGLPDPATTLTTAVEGLKSSDFLNDLLTRAGLRDDFHEAKLQVTRSPDFKEAVRTARDASSTNHRLAIARAILARAVLMAESRGETPAFLGNIQLRRDLIDACAAAIGPAEGTVPPWLTKPFIAIDRFARGVAVAGLAAGQAIVSAATKAGGAVVADVASRHAGRLVDRSYESFGDILVYQVRGKEIRQAISDEVGRVAAKGKKVVLLAHSLGGIASFEMLVEHAFLAEEMRPWDIHALALLITVGSQAPFLYELDALQTLRRTTTGDGSPCLLPPDFPAWLNLYDPSDLLSFLAAPIFPGRVFDEEINSRQPFPESHGAYWDHPKTWQMIKQYAGPRTLP